MNPKTKSKNSDKEESSITHRRKQAAARALAEAQERREAAKKTSGSQEQMPTETGGPRGAEPTRYGDWERKGITSDF